LLALNPYLLHCREMQGGDDFADLPTDGDEAKRAAKHIAAT
jgi:hypothetical protein